MRSIRGRDDLFTRATVHFGLRVMWMMRLDFYIHVPLALAMSVCIKKREPQYGYPLHRGHALVWESPFRWTVRGSIPRRCAFVIISYNGKQSCLLIAVCEYSYQFHPIGLLCGSIPHGVTILFFSSCLVFFAYFVHSKLSITARRLVTIFLHFGGKGPNRLV